MSRKNYYELLKIEPTASDKEIKSAYKKLALQVHPDKGKIPDPNIPDISFVELKEIFETLIDPEKRRLYDQVNLSPSRPVFSSYSPRPETHKPKFEHKNPCVSSSHFLISVHHTLKRVFDILMTGIIQPVEFQGSFKLFGSKRFEKLITIILSSPVPALVLSNLDLSDRQFYRSFTKIWEDLLRKKEGGLSLQKLSLSGNPIGIISGIKDTKSIITTSNPLSIRSARIASTTVFKKLMTVILNSSVHHLDLTGTILSAMHGVMIASMLAKKPYRILRIDLRQNPLYFYFSTGPVAAYSIGSSYNFNSAGVTALYDLLHQDKENQSFLSFDISDTLTDIDVTDLSEKKRESQKEKISWRQKSLVPYFAKKAESQKKGESIVSLLHSTIPSCPPKIIHAIMVYTIGSNRFFTTTGLKNNEPQLNQLPTLS